MRESWSTAEPLDKNRLRICPAHPGVLKCYMENMGIMNEGTLKFLTGLTG